ncbi:hypothetical protein WT27_07685 [Burkholderia territorii]|uniref:Uncharacterized protein n=1 Tax=Burkholderia territorii TaxID=1503055 RepID=A0A125BP35_9BURK|nr:hypothetical protein WT27_07685 [Burkholderia territorii]KVX32063.1 hypothetical protein WT31_01065 [Burkholderia territorii]
MPDLMYRKPATRKPGGFFRIRARPPASIVEIHGERAPQTFRARNAKQETATEARHRHRHRHRRRRR